MKKGIIFALVAALMLATTNKVCAMEIKLGSEKIEKQAYKKEETIMVPLREVAEKLGYSVRWDEEEKCVYVDKDVLSTKVNFDSNIYGLVAEKIDLGIMPEVINDTTFVPISYFENMLNVNITKEQDTLNFEDLNIVYARNENEIEVQVGQKVCILVKGSPNTGYDWVCKNNTIKLAEKRAYSNKYGDGEAPKIMSFIYDTKKKGKFSLEYQYKNKKDGKVLANAKYKIIVK